MILALAPIFLDVGFLQVVITAWLPTVGITPFQVGVLLTVQGILAVASSIPLGIASDIYGRKTILTVGVLAGSVGFMLYAASVDFGVLLVASAVLGFAEGSSVSVWNALLADLTDTDTRNKVFSHSYVMISIASGVGLLLPGLFPVIQAWVGASIYSIHRSMLLILGVVSFASPAGVVAILRGHRETHNPTRKFGGFRNMGTLAKLGLVGGSIGFGAGFIIPLVGTWFLLRFDVGDYYSGPVLAISSILIGLAAFAAPKMATKYGQLNAIVITAGSSVVFMLAMAFVPEVNLAAAFYVVRTGLSNMNGPLMDSFSISLFPADQRGLVSAATNTIFRLPNSVSTSFGGYLLGVGLLAYPFIIASALYAVGLSAFFAFFIASRKYSKVMAQG